MTPDSIFSVSVQRNQLVVAKVMGGVHRTLCMLDLCMKPSFYIANGAVVCRDQQGQEFRLDVEDGEADKLLAQLVIAKQAQSFLGKSKTFWVGSLVIAGVLIATGYIAALGHMNTQGRPEVASNATVPSLPAPLPASFAQINSNRSAQAVAAPKDNGWSLPASARLPEKLRNAADRKLFTVDYSSGHARTLYVFADPACPNCQRLEPMLEAASAAVNVVVFPVAVIGKEKSIASVTPVLCLPPEQRKAAWTALFDLGHDGLSLGKAPVADNVASGTAVDLDACADAQRALGVNEVAYKTYRIPGTPWVIADDGRHVSQALLNDPVMLENFLNSKGANDAAE